MTISREVRKPLLVFICGFVAMCPTADAQVLFRDATAEDGIGDYVMSPGLGGGVAAADFDDDGDVDLFVPNAGGVADQLYRNDNGVFVEIAASVGLASTHNNRVALWFDFDGDADLDLLVAGDCFGATCPGDPHLTLYERKDPLQFEDVTVAAGLPVALFDFDTGHIGGLAAGDINRDGYLDLVLALWKLPARLFLNNGDGTFADISVGSGVGLDPVQHWQPIMHDFDGDGWQDIYITVDAGFNVLWINQHDNTFVNQAPASNSDINMNDMGVALGDYDNDGDFDIYATNIFQFTSDERNVLLRNDSVGGSLSFVEIAADAGVDNGHWGWGTTFLDCDNDGMLDLAATNGFAAPPWETDPSRFFLNMGGEPVTFADVSSTVGFDDTHWGSALITLDYDRDGDLDLVQTCSLGGPLRLLENVPDAGNTNGYLVVKPRMNPPNTRAIGAVVQVTIEGKTQSRLITAGTSFLGQEPAEAFFGLADATSVDVLTIRWPDGTVDVLTDVPGNQVVTVTATGGSIPAASGWGVLAMVLVVMAAGTIVFKRLTVTT